MFKEVIPNFEITQKLAETSQAIVYKAFQKKSPEAPLIIKILKSGYLPEHQKLHFRQKIEQLKVLNDPMLIRPLSFEVRDDIQFITREYFDGIPLNEWAASQNKVSLNDFLLSPASWRRHCKKPMNPASFTEVSSRTIY